MRVLITGGAGYIGSELVGVLLNAGHNVHVVDNLTYGSDSLLRYVGNDKFEFDNIDVRQEKDMAKMLAKADVILPMAALVGFPLCEKKSLEAIQVNFEVNKWIATNKSKDQILIYPCTNSGYGATTNGIACTEESPINPVSVYGITKVDAEIAYKAIEGCSTIRLATVFGPSTRMRTDLLVNNFVWKAIKDRSIVLYECTFMRNYVHIWDVCNAFNFIIDNWDSCKNETFNVGNDSINANKLELAEQIQKHIKFEIIKAEINSDPDVRNYIVSSQKFYNKGFSCQHNLDDGVKQLIKAYKLIDKPFYGNY